MNPENILNAGSKLRRLFTGRTSRARLNGIKASLCPTKIFYLWEKHGIRRIELFSME
ncbi:MAG: hypothetical protein NTX59_06350 [Elusimicrobia bacterium]|nr:hypothetical protein [Elusimicrobiota bacterium]